MTIKKDLLSISKEMKKLSQKTEGLISDIEKIEKQKEKPTRPRAIKKVLAKKKAALFVCCGSTEPLDDKTEKAKSIEKARTKYLEEKAAKYDLQPVALGLFGGVYNFNKVPWLFGKFMESIKPQLEEAGVPQTEPGLYDTRDINAIRIWAKEVAQMVQS